MYICTFNCDRHTYVLIHVHMYGYIHMFLNKYAYLCVYRYMYIRMFISVYVYICMHRYICIYTYCTYVFDWICKLTTQYHIWSLRVCLDINIFFRVSYISIDLYKLFLTFIYIFINKSIHMYTYKCIHIDRYLHIDICIYMCTYIYVQLPMYIHMCIYFCVYIYKYICWVIIVYEK